MTFIMRVLAVICGAFVAAQGGWAQAERRVALVIGNSAYQHTRALPNPKNDAEAVAKLLRDSGFAEVVLKLDLDYRAMREAVRAFRTKAREADVAMVYYAGHGIEVAGENHLVPIDAKLERDDDLQDEAVTLSTILGAVANARRLRLIVLDACRNNPLGDKMSLSTGAVRSVTRGLGRIEPKGDVLVAYAARAGTVARDGSGGHSPYAQALLKHMPTPGLDVRLMFGKVRDAVLAATGNEQEPWTYGSLSGDVVAIVPGAALTEAQLVELKLFDAVKDSTAPAVLRTYLEQYPDGEFASIVRTLVEKHEQRERAELAAREEARRRQEEERIAATVKRIEEERRAREAALAEERRRAEDAKNGAEAKLVEEKQRTEWLARTEELRKLTEQMKQAREELAASEKKRLAAVKAAEAATKTAEQTIATKREAEKSGNPTKLAALPKIEAAPGTGQLNGNWTIQWSIVSGCTKGTRGGGSYVVTAVSGKLVGHQGRLSGTISDAGAVRWSYPSPADGTQMSCSGTLGSGQGSGTCFRVIGGCEQRFSATRF